MGTIRATFQKRPDGTGLLSVIHQEDTGSQISETQLALLAVESEDQARKEADRVAKGAPYRWVVT